MAKRDGLRGSRLPATGEGAAATVDEATPAPATYDEWRSRRWRLTALASSWRWVLFGGTLA